MSLRIGLDIDGVLADFNTPFVQILEEESGRKLPAVSETFPHTWHYPAALGISPEVEKKCWDRVKASPDFWRTIPAYDEAEPFLRDLAQTYAMSDEIYFITTRVGAQVKQQTEEWLIENGFDFNVTVLVTASKGPVAKALKLTHFIDDKNENCLSVAAESPFTKAYMLARPWNQAQTGIPRIYSLDFFLRELAIASGQLVEAHG